MTAKTTPMALDVASRFEGAVLQFRGLNANDPGQWPILPRAAAWLAVVVLTVIAGWFLLLSGATDELQAERDREPQLKQDYKLLVSIPGVAFVTAAVILAEMGDLRRFGRARQATAFAGVTPRQSASGTSVAGIRASAPCSDLTGSPADHARELRAGGKPWSSRSRR